MQAENYCLCVKVHSYSWQRKADDKPSCLLSQKSCSAISISTIIACTWCYNDGRKIMGEVFKVECEMHTHAAHYFWKDVCALQDLHFFEKLFSGFVKCLLYWSIGAAIKLREGFYKWSGFAWLWGIDFFWLKHERLWVLWTFFLSAKPREKSPFGAAGWADAENELVSPTFLISTCRPSTYQWTLII